MSDAHAVARDQLRSFIERIERLEEEKKTIADDIKDVKSEAKGCGFDVGIINAVLKLRKVDANERAEKDALLDTYLIALGMLPEPEEAEPVNAKLIATVATGMQTEIGRKALVAALDIMIDREEEEDRRSDNGLNIQTKHEDIRTAPVTAEEHPHHLKTTRGDESGTLEGSVEDHGQVAGCKPESQTDGNETVTVVGDESGTVTTPKVLDGGSPVAGESRHHCDVSEDDAGQTLTGTPHSEKATVATQGEATEATSAEREDRAAANEGGTDVARSATRAGLADPTSNTVEGAANTALPADSVKLEYVPPTGMKRLPFAHCFPELSKAEYERLEKHIAANRVQTPIIRQGDVIVDGFARYTIARKYGFSYPVQEYTGTDVLLDVIEWQRASRNFTPAQERKIAADLAKELPHRADDIMAAFGLAEALEAAE